MSIAEVNVEKMNEMALKALKAFERQNEIMSELVESGMAPLQAVVVSGDMAHMEKIDSAVKQGLLEPTEAVNLIGSYARFDWALVNLEREDFFKRLPELWVESDPNDSTDRLPLWREAYRRNGNKVVTDGKRLKQPEVLVIFRGQLGDELGISWSLDQNVARRFAKTGGGRVPVSGGKVVCGVVNKREVLAYLTSRSEEEVIVDPMRVRVVSEAVA